MLTSPATGGRAAEVLCAAECRELAVRYLSRREYSVKELKRKLQQRGVSRDTADEVVERLASDDLVSDQRFTQMYVRTRVRHLFGPLKIRGELRSRGVEDDIIGENMPPEEDWIDVASRWIDKKVSGELDYAKRAKTYHSLVNRGFRHEQANVALDRFSSQD